MKRSKKAIFLGSVGTTSSGAASGYPSNMLYGRPAAWRDMPASAIDNLPASILVPTYLMSSYLYYEHDEAVISDGAYDRLCRKLIEMESMWRNHQHAHLVDIEALKAGTGYHIKYPDRVKYAAQRWLKSATGRDITISKETQQ